MTRRIQWVIGLLAIGLPLVGYAFVQAGENYSVQYDNGLSAGCGNLYNQTHEYGCHGILGQRLVDVLAWGVPGLVLVVLAVCVLIFVKDDKPAA